MLEREHFSYAAARVSSAMTKLHVSTAVGITGSIVSAAIGVWIGGLVGGLVGAFAPAVVLLCLWLWHLIQSPARVQRRSRERIRVLERELGRLERGPVAEGTAETGTTEGLDPEIARAVKSLSLVKIQRSYPKDLIAADAVRGVGSVFVGGACFEDVSNAMYHAHLIGWKEPRDPTTQFIEALQGLGLLRAVVRPSRSGARFEDGTPEEDVYYEWRELGRAVWEELCEGAT